MRVLFLLKKKKVPKRKHWQNKTPDLYKIIRKTKTGVHTLMYSCFLFVRKFFGAPFFQKRCKIASPYAFFFPTKPQIIAAKKRMAFARRIHHTKPFKPPKTVPRATQRKNSTA